jgi:hypothetical protein
VSIRWSGLNPLAFHPEAEFITLWVKCTVSWVTGEVVFGPILTCPVSAFTRTYRELER